MRIQEPLLHILSTFTAPDRDGAEKALRAGVRSLVRIALKLGLRFQEFDQMARQEFTRLAGEELKRIGEQVTDSRLSAVSGLTRREIGKYRSAAGASAESIHPSLPARVLGLWECASEYCDSDGSPKPLSSGSAQSEFSKLCAAVSQDLNPATVAFELERVGAVTKRDDKLHLSRRSYTPKEDLTASVSLLEHDLFTLYGSVLENIFLDEPQKNLHATTIFTAIRAGDLAKVKKWILQEGHEFHKRVRQFLSQFDQDTSPQQSDGNGVCAVTVTTASVCTSPLEQDPS